MITWLSVELAGRAKLRGSHPKFRSSTTFSSREHASKTNISLYFTFPGFTLLENNQKRCSVPYADESAVTFSHHFKLSSVKIIHNAMKAMTSKNIGKFGDRSFGRDQHQAKFISEIFLKTYIFITCWIERCVSYLFLQAKQEPRSHI